VFPAASNPAEVMSSIWWTTLLAMSVPLLGGLAATAGAIAWARIRRSGGRLRGSPLAVSALAIGALLVVASPFLLLATHRANMHRQFPPPQERPGGAGAGVARAETASPATTEVPVTGRVDYNPRALTWWSAFRSMGVFGLLVLFVGLCVLVSILAGFFCGRIFWLPAAAGAGAMVLGLLGTVFGMIIGFRTVADLGGAVGPGDLASGIEHSLVTSIMGLGVLVVGVLGTVGLAVFHGYRREAAARAAG